MNGVMVRWFSSDFPFRGVAREVPARALLRLDAETISLLRPRFLVCKKGDDAGGFTAESFFLALAGMVVGRLLDPASLQKYP